MPVVAINFYLLRKSEKFHQLIITYYIPSGAFAFLSLFSFFVKPEMVPGRMGMLVTIFLIVIGIYKSVEAPPKRGFGYLEKWYIGVQVPILFALLEYGFMLAVLKYKEGHQEIVIWGQSLENQWCVENRGPCLFFSQSNYLLLISYRWHNCIFWPRFPHVIFCSINDAKLWKKVDLLFFVSV